MPPDIRWQQRFANFCRALERLEDFFKPPPLNDREQQGLIKAFEYCYELGWNTLGDLLRSEGNALDTDRRPTSLSANTRLLDLWRAAGRVGTPRHPDRFA